MEEVEKALRFDGGRWSVLGNVEDVKRSDGRRKIIDALGNYGSKQSPKEIAEGTGMKVNNVNSLLLKMVKAGEVVKDGYGTYSVPTDQSGQTDQSPSTQYLGKYFDAEMPDAQVELARSLDLERLRGALGYQGGSDPGHGVEPTVPWRRSGRIWDSAVNTPRG